MPEIAPEVELANLEESNASRLAALMDPKRPNGIRTLPAGFLEQMQAAIFLEHIARVLGCETDAKLDFEENLELVIADMEHE